MYVYDSRLEQHEIHYILHTKRSAALLQAPSQSVIRALLFISWLDRSGQQILTFEETGLKFHFITTTFTLLIPLFHQSVLPDIKTPNLTPVPNLDLRNCAPMPAPPTYSSDSRYAISNMQEPDSLGPPQTIIHIHMG